MKKLIAFLMAWIAFSAQAQFFGGGGVSQSAITNLQAQIDAGIASKADISGSNITNPAAFRAAIQISNPSILPEVRGLFKNPLKSMSIGIATDSTGFYPNWPYYFAQLVASNYPSMTVNVVDWDPATSNRNTTVIQTGTAGKRYLYSTNEVGNAYFLIGTNGPTEDIEIQATLCRTNWSTGYDAFVDTRNSSSVEVSTFSLFDGKFILKWTTNANGSYSANYAMSTTTNSFSSGSTNAVKVALDVNPAGGYTVKFYYGQDGITWTQLGSTVTSTNWTVLTGYDAATTIRASAANAFKSDYKYYSLIVRDGIGGQILTPPLDNFSGGAVSPVLCGGSPVFTIYNLAQLGATEYTFSNAVYRLNFPRTLPAVIASFGHNDLQFYAPTYPTIYSYLNNMASQIALAAPNARLIVATQNPRGTNSVSYSNQGIWCAYQIAAAKKLGFTTLDVYSHMMANGWNESWTSEDTAADLHPNSAVRSGVWAPYVYNSIFTAY